MGSEIRDRLEKLRFIVGGLENNESFKQFIELFREDANRADETWHNCIVEDEKGRMLFYQLRANKLSVIALLLKLEELKNEIESLEEELKTE